MLEVDVLENVGVDVFENVGMRLCVRGLDERSGQE